MQGDTGKQDVLCGLAARFAPIFFIDDTREEIERARSVAGVMPLLLDRSASSADGSYADLTAVAEYIRTAIGNRTPEAKLPTA